MKMTLGASQSGGNMPLFLALEHGYFSDAGIDVTRKVVKGSSESLPLTAAGRIHVSGSAIGAGFFNAFENGNTLIDVGSLQACPPRPPTIDPIVAIPAMFENGVFRPERLKGKPYGLLGRHSGAEYATMLAFKKWGLTLDDVQIKELSFPNLIAALGTEAIAACWLVQPEASALEKKGIALPASVDTDLDQESLNVIFNRDFALQNKDAVAGFMAAVIRAGNEAQELGWKHPSVAKVAAKYLDVDQSVPESVDVTYFRKDAAINRTSLSDMQKYYMQTNALTYKSLLDIDKVVDDSYRQTALKLLEGS